MASVSQLGYLGFGVSDAKAWQDLVAAVPGMQVVPGDDQSTTYLRMDEYHHRLELRSTATEDLECVGWEVPDPARLQRVDRQAARGRERLQPGEGIRPVGGIPNDRPPFDPPHQHGAEAPRGTEARLAGHGRKGGTDCTNCQRPL